MITVLSTIGFRRCADTAGPVRDVHDPLVIEQGDDRGVLKLYDYTVDGLPTGRVLLHHYGVDREHSNAYTLWRTMGEPQDPTHEQYDRLERAGRLEMLTSPLRIDVRDGSAEIRMLLRDRPFHCCELPGRRNHEAGHAIGHGARHQACRVRHREGSRRGGNEQTCWGLRWT